jgi:hypothetical protein
MHITGIVAVASLATSAFWTANDPFVGKWRLDVARSTIVDEMRVEALGQNRYAFSFEGGPTETIVADGTDQPGSAGTTLAVKARNARTLTVLRKQNGRIRISAIWKLSTDGRTLRDEFTSLQPDGSKFATHFVYKRASGTSGFAGTWESTTKPVGLKLQLEIRPYDKKGLTFVSAGPDRSVIFDGREHAVPGAVNGQTLSGRRRAPRMIEYTEKNRGKTERRRSFELSADGRILTETLRPVGQITPTVFAFERE